MLSNSDSDEDRVFVFLGLLTIFMILLKLSELIKIDWLCVLAPIWMPLVFGMFVSAIYLIVTVIRIIIEGVKSLK